MRKFVAAFALLALPISVAAQTVGPVVIDPTKITIHVEQFTQTLLQWTQQKQQMDLISDTNAANLQILDQQFQTMTSNFMLGSLFNNINQTLPPNWQASFNAIPQQGASALTSDAQQIYSTAMLYNRCTQSDPTLASLCQANAARTAQNLANMNEGLQNISNEDQQINLLKCQVDITRDAKSSQDIISRMQAEQANITLQDSILKMYVFSDAKQNDLVQELQQQQTAKTLDRQGGIPSTVSSFSSP
ncbi:type IV secretion system protein [Methylovirgula sp. 4M-Z18]|uniref:type IV secretion system protein n=1 Tax=Methylovirgula sp. 4M-Z18 TaxID=2293567 RepID=UPI000E2FAD0C|nr:type IV secretion system protein [Methylovirgula sp. 4M-Z18]RFB76666.1 hypothetical protein DYH55_19610 [Methylovirgula sp. 4M-Z18]